MAKKEYYDKEITDATDWGGDASTGGKKVKGNRVQEYIKKKLSAMLSCEVNDDPASLLA